ncbi:MAG: hypothetical protein ACPGVC_07615 [Salibacteraceae bacterium]
MNYQNINPTPDTINAGNVLSRFLDGLAFRFYWATENLKDKDLAYKPSESGMRFTETMEHMVWLSVMIKNAMNGEPSDRAINQEVKGIPLVPFSKGKFRKNFNEVAAATS